jgi:hypothetical protein
MTVGGSIFLIAVGAILRYAVTVTVSGISLHTVGLILMIAGIIGLVVGLFMYASARRTTYGGPHYPDRDPLV